MPLYEVTVVKNLSQVIYVEADNEDDAHEDAWELAHAQPMSFSDWDVDDSWADLRVIQTVPKGKQYWSGGPDGDWVG
jgi:hypothetical protein